MAELPRKTTRPGIDLISQEERRSGACSDRDVDVLRRLFCRTKPAFRQRHGPRRVFYLNQCPEGLRKRLFDGDIDPFRDLRPEKGSAGCTVKDARDSHPNAADLAS